MLSYQKIGIARVSFLAALVLLLVANTGAVGESSALAAISCDQAISFRSDDFSSPTTIDNTFLPLVPGTQLTLDGSINPGSGSVPHRVVVTVTDLTKVLNGVQTVVLWDTDTNDGQLVESELAFFAQDNARNVWNLGEYPEEYEGGVLTGAPSTWIGGLDGAKAGIHMLAEPQVGTPSYRQGRVPKIKFFDCAQVFEAGQSISVPFGSYQDVLVANEWSPLDPASGIQRKYYAPGVGNILITAVDDPEGETLQLTSLVHLTPEALAEVRGAALELDTRAYSVSAVYGKTPPAE